MKQLYLLLAFIITCVQLRSQVQQRIILIGDAGEMDTAQKAVTHHAAAQVLPGKTTVLYLGDNIYPRGMGLPGSKEEPVTKQVLQSQYQPFRQQGATVYFLPGNHDWDKMGPKGLQKIKYQWQYLDEQGDSLLKMIPANGCADPVEIPLGNQLVIIAYDSEWWLYPFDKTNNDAECDCKSRQDMLLRLEALRYKNRNKMIVVASHHPFMSYGIHGGYFTWKDHLFPLTAANKNWYVPLPVIGSLYPFLRSTFTNPEDLKHPLYKALAKSVTDIFDSFPNVVYAAGHEHGLQLIKDKYLQIVSGAGAKHTPTQKGKYSLFADATQGYVIADLMPDNSLQINFYTYNDTTVQQAYSYTQAYTPIADNPATAALMNNDSVTVQAHAAYDKVGRFHRFLFGENYRKEWAAPTTLPVIRLDQINGGLTATQLGGGMQSKSLRLVDKQGREWVVRSIEKSAEKLLPGALRETFARDALEDVTSGQHPYSALMVPPLAHALKVPHSQPVIGVLAPAKGLGIYENRFAGMLVLLEEREPLGKSDNTLKAIKNLDKDNDNNIDGHNFLQARILDAFLADWDRHEDQWRWYDTAKGKDKHYVGIPRDRDQVLHVSQGVFPSLASCSFILPTFRDFNEKMDHTRWLFFKNRFMNNRPSFQFSRQQWLQAANDFTLAMTDSVLEASLQRLPASSYNLRHDALLQKLKARRSLVTTAVDRYYTFSHKIIDLKLSDKNELVQITDADSNRFRISIWKLNKNGETAEELMSTLYERSVTKEVRLYLGNGNDSVAIQQQADVKFRIIGGTGNKHYHVQTAGRRVQLYDLAGTAQYTGLTNRLKLHTATDSNHTAYTPTNLYNIWMPLFTAGVNVDDGFILGAGFKYTHQQGFRKSPYADMHQLMIAHSFSTKAYRLAYSGEWLHVLGKTDVTIKAIAKAPDNVFNYFGLGNETQLTKFKGYRNYYRTRYNSYQLDPSFRWRGRKGSMVSVGPSLYYYSFDKEENGSRFINQSGAIGSYDSSNYAASKLHMGISVAYVSDKRNNIILPQWGSYVNIRINTYKGISSAARSFTQLTPEIALYKPLNARATIILAERFGGTLGFGNPGFYQLAMLGGHNNLQGFNQYRFAGQHSFYNNLELRIKLADFAGYILPGQFGISGFWDAGRVWQKNDNSGKWHHGTGGGIYFAPASMLVANLVMGHSDEGWYPYFTFGFRF
jgi:hypothetical protein